MARTRQSAKTEIEEKDKGDAPAIPGGASGQPPEAVHTPLVDGSPVVGSAVAPAAASPKVAAPKRFRVVRGGLVMSGGFRAPLRAGKIIDERTYDLRSLRAQGVELRELAEGEV